MGRHALTLPRLQRQNAQHAIEVDESGNGVSVVAVPGLMGEEQRVKKPKATISSFRAFSKRRASYFG
ncbi:MAG TPA: hypothetical protein VF778_12535, partial [Xanthobacteraceae bacterium]